METAVPIDGSNLMKTYRKLKVTKKQPLEGWEDNALARLAEDPGWKVLKARVEADIESLGGMTEVLGTGDSVEIVGFKFLATRIAMAHLQGIIDIVDATATSVAEQQQPK